MHYMHSLYYWKLVEILDVSSKSIHLLSTNHPLIEDFVTRLKSNCMSKKLLIDLFF